MSKKIKPQPIDYYSFVNESGNRILKRKFNHDDPETLLKDLYVFCMLDTVQNVKMVIRNSFEKDIAFTIMECINEAIEIKLINPKLKNEEGD